MEKTIVAPNKTTPSKAGGNDSEHLAQASAAKQAFVGAALNMSWQLAVVVLVPVIGGFKLDVALKTSPLFVSTGFVIAMLGMAIILWRQLQILSPHVSSTTSTKEKSV